MAVAASTGVVDPRMETIMDNSIRKLDIEEINVVSGGMKWTRVNNPDVIDARGGQFTALGLTFTVDLDGHITSITPR